MFSLQTFIRLDVSVRNQMARSCRKNYFTAPSYGFAECGFKTPNAPSSHLIFRHDGVSTGGCCVAGATFKVPLLRPLSYFKFFGKKVNIFGFRQTQQYLFYSLFILFAIYLFYLLFILFTIYLFYLLFILFTIYLLYLLFYLLFILFTIYVFYLLFIYLLFLFILFTIYLFYLLFLFILFTIYLFYLLFLFILFIIYFIYYLFYLLFIYFILFYFIMTTCFGQLTVMRPPLQNLKKVQRSANDIFVLQDTIKLTKFV